MSIFDQGPVMFPIDGSDVDDAALKGTGGTVDDECGCHFVCNGFQLPETTEGTTPSIRVDLMVVASDKKEQVNKFVFHRVYTMRKDKNDKTGKTILPLDKDGKARLLKFFIRMGIVNQAEAVGNPSYQIPLHLLAGRQVCGWIKKEQKKDKDGKTLEGQFDYRLPFGDVWPVDDPRVERIPKSPEYLAMAGAAGVAGGVGEAGGAADGDIDF